MFSYYFFLHLWHLYGFMHQKLIVKAGQAGHLFKVGRYTQMAWLKNCDLKAGLYMESMGLFMCLDLFLYVYIPHQTVLLQKRDGI